MKKNKFIIGIDVSKKKLDVSLLLSVEAKNHEHFIVSNDSKGIKFILTRLTKLKIPLIDCLFCFENTGVYSMPLSINLSEKKLDYCEINALEIKRSKGISRGKDDKTDAKDIAFYAHTHMHKLKLSKLPEKDILQLKLLFAEREKMIKAIGVFDKTKENEGFMSKDMTKKVMQFNKSTVAFLKKKLKAIEAEMQRIISENETLNQQFNLACSVPGVGPQTAMYMLIVTKSFTAFDDWRKMACYAGIAPFQYTSGSSVRGRTKVNHMADKKMKSLLHMCALNIKVNDPEIALYYKRKTEEGKNPMLVLNNIRGKVLSRVFATVKRGTPYINLKKYIN